MRQSVCARVCRAGRRNNNSPTREQISCACARRRSRRVDADVRRCAVCCDAFDQFCFLLQRADSRAARNEASRDLSLRAHEQQRVSAPPPGREKPRTSNANQGRVRASPRPSLCALMPHVEPDFKCLLLNQLPFQEVRLFALFRLRLLRDARAKRAFATTTRFRRSIA